MMEPVHILFNEPPDACSLKWLPLAVRFKLDAVGVRIGLLEWRGLAFKERLALLACPPGQAFEELLRSFVPQARRVPCSVGSYAEYLLAKQDARARA